MRPCHTPGNGRPPGPPLQPHRVARHHAPSPMMPISCGTRNDPRWHGRHDVTSETQGGRRGLSTATHPMSNATASDETPKLCPDSDADVHAAAEAITWTSDRQPAGRHSPGAGTSRSFHSLSGTGAPRRHRIGHWAAALRVTQLDVPAVHERCGAASGDLPGATHEQVHRYIVLLVSKESLTIRQWRREVDTAVGFV